MIELKFTYKNHKGEVEPRRVDFHGLDYIPAPGFGYKPGWFITGFDLDKNAIRSFSMENILTPETGGTTYRIYPKIKD